ncbi:MAG: glycosyltransferase family A protein, partial [Eubacteriales bacterium]
MSEVVSVVIPTYNAVKYIERTLDSILQQTYRDLEILVVDDCSTDGTREVIKAYQDQNPEILIHMIELEENQGPAAARNEGIRQASGRYLAFLDADDIWEPEKTYEQLIFMKRYQAA